jgi:2-polyprenyl-3-methyl-5-hydroxy-6-metoxy-1,4-benzoquinol methylase
MEKTNFYDSLSCGYDSMTEFSQRFKKEEFFFRKIIEDNSLKNGIDVGCGTGFHSILLSRLGLNLIGIDPSSKMIEIANKNKEQSGENVNFFCTDLSGFVRSHKTKFDAVFCMGNMLPHILSRKSLDVLFKGFFKILSDDGIVITQTLNYNKILHCRERIVNIKEVGNKIFIRFYDFGEELVRFNILILTKDNSVWSHRLLTTELYPYRLSDFINIAKQNGFSSIRKFGNMKFDKFDSRYSDNLILIYKKQR